jgi:hypothetical protein
MKSLDDKTDPEPDSTGGEKNKVIVLIFDLNNRVIALIFSHLAFFYLIYHFSFLYSRLILLFYFW